MTTKTPLEKLIRLRELSEAMRAESAACSTPTARYTALQREADGILASTAAPPLELIGRADSHAWADAFAVAFPQFDRDTAQLWFVNVMLAGVEAGRDEGYAAGSARAAQGLGVPELVDTLRLVRDGLKAGRIKAPPTVDGSAPVGTPPRPFVELVVEALAQAGVTE